MSTKIKLTAPIGGHKAGDTIEVTAGVADYLTTIDRAEEVKGRSKKTTEAPEGVGGTPSTPA